MWQASKCVCVRVAWVIPSEVMLCVLAMQCYRRVHVLLLLLLLLLLIIWVKLYYLNDFP